MWQEAQFASITGSTAFSNDGLWPERGADFGGEMDAGITWFDGSSATSFIVRSTSSPVLTSPAMLIGPMPNVDIFTLVLAVASSRPSWTTASTFQVTAAGVSRTVSWLGRSNW